MRRRNKIAKTKRKASSSVTQHSALLCEVKKHIQGKSKKRAMKSSFWKPKELGNSLTERP